MTNRMHRPGSVLPAMLVCLLSQPLCAEDADTLTDPPDRYQVEVIVFRHLDQSVNTPEEPALVPRREPFAAEPAPDAAAEEAPDPSQQTAPEEPDLQRADPSELSQFKGQLEGVHARLERLDAYEPLLYNIWVQAALPADEAIAVPISIDDRTDVRVTGVIRLYKGRFVHLEVDLDLEPATVGALADDGTLEPVLTFGDAAAASGFADEPLPLSPTRVFRLRESRRIRSGNAQYYDHAQFGVIATVVAVEYEEEEDAENEDLN